MEYNRDKDGKFAPKGTGDKTGFEKGFHKAMPKNPAPKEVKLPFGDKPRLEDVQSDLYDLMNAQYDDDAHEADTASKVHASLIEAAGRAEPEEAEALRKEAEGWKRHADEIGAKDSIVIGAWENENTSINDNVGKWAKKNGYQVRSDVWGNQQLAKDGKLYGYKAKTVKDPEGKSIISIKLEEQDERGEPVKKSVLPF